MPPKKRDKDSEASKNSKIDHLQADHELFLQAFEKPTQIYRFLRTRNMLSPIFLNRTLSYMKRRMSRSNKSRNGFKVDSLLEKITLKKSTELQPNSLGGYMTLTFLGFYDKTLEDSRDYQVKVETLLLKICHKKRKESSSAIVEVSVGSCSVPLNPSTSEPPAMASAVSISSDTFSPSHGPNVKSYMLMLRVTVTRAGNTSNGSASSSEITNGDLDEPVTKRLKSTHEHSSDKWSKLYGSELIVYDKHNRCLLTNGEYDLVLHDATPGGRSATIARSPHKALMAQWETIPSENDLHSETSPFDVFKVRPLLKLKLSWSQEPTNGLVNRPKLYQQSNENGIKKEPGCSKDRLPKSSTNDIKNGEKIKGESSEGNGGESKRQQIIYQFLYNNNSRQQTEACDDLHCPWCSLDCGTLYSLLKHLKLCHSRFNFTYFPIPGGARIDVSINELYDGSYTGSPHDLIAAQGRGAASGPRAGPTRRTELTHVLVWRPRGPARRRTPRHSLAEFLELDDSELAESQRPYLTGHNRLYHHTITCLPVYPNELDIDSEGETDPLWLQQKTMMMIDEFTDVNEGEKELMKMWNLHVMKYNYVGDCQIPIACQKFLQMKGKELLEKNLYRNFILHMCSLHDFGLLSPIALYQTNRMLNQMLADNAEAKEKMRSSIKAQREHWDAVGKYQQPAIIEQKPQTTTAKLNSVEASPSVRRKTSNLQANRMASASSSFKSSSPSRDRPGDTKRKMSSGSIQSPQITASKAESCTYAVTVSKKPTSQEALCSNQRSFISIHSTDQLCQIADTDSALNLEECNVEVLSLNEVFPSTSEESLSNDDDMSVPKKLKNPKKTAKARPENAEKTSYVPMNSKSATGARQKDLVEGQTSVFSDFDIPKNTLHVVGSNPGEPKMSYQDPPKKISKTMKKFLRNIDKHKNEQNSKNSEKALSKLTTMRGILKDGRCDPECTGDSVHGPDTEYNLEDLTLPLPMDFSHHGNYTKQGPDKSVSFNTQVVIIHFTGDLCVGQSVETLSKEKDQQARNSELRKTFLTKYNEFWPTQK